MAFRIVWSPEAVDDLEAIKNFIARDSEQYAKSIVKKILDKAKTISLFPHHGRIVPELNNKKLREVFVFDYRCIYRVQEQRVTILAIIHGKRLITNIEERL